MPVAPQSQTGKPSGVSNFCHVGCAKGSSAASLWSIRRLAVRCIDSTVSSQQPCIARIEYSNKCKGTG